MEGAERIAPALAEAERRRMRVIPGSAIVELDGIVVTLSNLPDPELNGGVAYGMPADPEATVADLVRIVADAGHDPALEVEAGRLPALEAALAARGFTRVVSRPVLAVHPKVLWRPLLPAGLRLMPVTDGAGLAAAIHVDAAAFGTSKETSSALYGPRLLDEPDMRAFVGLFGGSPVAAVVAHRHEATVGLYGVAVTEPARRRGIGAALSVTAATAFGTGCDLAWLLPSEMARAMYRRLGFRPLSTWEVWSAPRS